MSIGFSVPSSALGRSAAGTAYESIVSTLVPNWYPRECGSGIDESSAAGSAVEVRPSGWNIRSSKACDADIPVSCSMMTPSSTMFVLLYSNVSPGAKFGGW